MSGRLVRWLLSLAPRIRRTGPPTLVIVRHHRVYGPTDRPLYRLGVSESILDHQLRLLARHGHTPVSVSAGIDALRRGREGVHVAFSFDDGYLDNATRAVPVLRRHGATATFYLTAGLMEERRAPWWDRLVWILERSQKAVVAAEVAGDALTLPTGTPAERGASLRAMVARLRVPPADQERRLRALAHAAGVTDEPPCELATWEQAGPMAAGGMEVGAHTWSHPFLSLLETDAQRREIGDSIARITDRLGLRPRGLAYPGGDHDDRTVAVCAELELDHAVTTLAGQVRAVASPFRLPRRGWSEGACLGPRGRFSNHLAFAEFEGAFDGLRRGAAEPST